MLRKTILLTSALVGAELLAGATMAQAGGMGHFQMPHVNAGNVSGKLNCPGVGSSHNSQAGMNVYAPVRVTSNVNNSTNINVNRALNVYSPVTVNSSIDNSVNINNSKYIDTSTNISVNKEINVRTTNIFNGGFGSGSDHSQGGSWGSHTGGGNMGGGSNQNNNGNNNSNGNQNSNSNSQNVRNSNTVNNSNSIDASGTINSFFNGLRGIE